jgi:hypothetical protein
MNFTPLAKALTRSQDRSSRFFSSIFRIGLESQSGTDAEPIIPLDMRKKPRRLVNSNVERPFTCLTSHLLVTREYPERALICPTTTLTLIQ